MLGGGSKSCADGYLCQTDMNETKINDKSPNDYFIFHQCLTLHVQQFHCTPSTVGLTTYLLLPLHPCIYNTHIYPHLHKHTHSKVYSLAHIKVQGAHPL